MTTEQDAGAGRDKAAEPAVSGAQDANLYDCIVIGAGPAGLSAALYLGRLLRSVLVLDDNHGRSTWHQVNRNYLGFPDGVHASALRDLGETQAKQYGVEFIDACAEDASYEGEGPDRRFTVLTGTGEFVSRTLIFATGVRDEFPEFEGSLACIGKSMFWCPICDGYETIGQRVVVLGHGTRAATLALELLVFTDKITLVAWDKALDIEPERLQQLTSHGIKVYDSGCQVYTCSKEGQLSNVRLSDGTVIELDRLFVAQKMWPNTQLAKKLRVKVDDSGFIITDTEQLTNIDGVFAAGDVTKLFSHQISSAVHEGGMAASAANYYLYEDWQKE